MISIGSVDKVLNSLGEIEVEVIMSRSIGKSAFSILSRRWKMRHGDSERSLIFSLRRINEIPKVVRDVVKNKGEIISVLYLKESIDRILQGE
jgi:hypothetical protein